VTHYWSHGHFMPDGALSVNAARLAGIPGILVCGALDLGVSVDLLWRLARDWREGDLVVIDDEGHRGGLATDAALVHATDTFAKQEHHAAD
jgi:proline iminopeptidase